jgi:hypothetical protein
VQFELQLSFQKSPILNSQRFLEGQQKAEPEYEEQGRAAREKTARLRALRLARKVAGADEATRGKKPKWLPGATEENSSETKLYDIKKVRRQTDQRLKQQASPERSFGRGRKEQGGTMTHIFREYARQCVQLAGRADTPKQLRERLLQMAREYMAEASRISLTDLDHPRSVGNIPQTQNIEI